MKNNWIWGLAGWPKFEYDASLIAKAEADFLQNCGYLLGAYNKSSSQERQQLKIALVCEEAVETSAIEGEFLDRTSVQASLMQNFGLLQDKRRIPASEQGIAVMMSSVYESYAKPLSKEMLCEWHLALLGHRHDLTAVGCYRFDKEPMQIVSGSISNPRVHYEALPAELLESEMDNFINWYNNCTDLPVLAQAAIAHLYFELIHPFEDGNGRIGRALISKIVGRACKQPILLAFSKIIQANKKLYYSSLEKQNRSLYVDDWLLYFADLMLKAQDYTRTYMGFLNAKIKIFDRVGDKLNQRQTKVLDRLFRAGPEGYIGGLSADNYISITKASRATATRDLADLVALGVLSKSGQLKATRYHLSWQKL